MTTTQQKTKTAPQEFAHQTNRILYYNYELKKGDSNWKKYVFRDDIKADHGITKGSIRMLCQDYIKHGKTSQRRYKWKDYTIRYIKESRGCLIVETEIIVNKKNKTVTKFVPNNKSEDIIIFK